MTLRAPPPPSGIVEREACTVGGRHCLAASLLRGGIPAMAPCAQHGTRCCCEAKDRRPEQEAPFCAGGPGAACMLWSCSAHLHQAPALRSAARSTQHACRSTPPAALQLAVGRCQLNASESPSTRAARMRCAQPLTSTQTHECNTHGGIWGHSFCRQPAALPLHRCAP